jgi:hypothetical protein
MSLYSLIPLLTAALWPLTVIILVFWFRRGLKSLLASITEARIGNNVFTFGQAKSDKTLPEPAHDPPPASSKEISAQPPSRAIGSRVIDWSHTGNLFWLGHDLQWTAQMALRGAPKETILHGLRQSYHNLYDLGGGEIAAAKLLKRLESQAENLPETALDRNWRNDFTVNLGSVITEVGTLAQKNQTNFRASP